MHKAGLKYKNVFKWIKFISSRVESCVCYMYNQAIFMLNVVCVNPEVFMFLHCIDVDPEIFMLYIVLA